MQIRIPWVGLCAMFVSGVFFCVLGIVTGLVVYALINPQMNDRVSTLDFFRPGNLGISLMLAAMVGGIPAFVTGTIAVPLCRRIQQFWLFVPAIMATGAIATALYLPFLELDPTDKFGAPVMACGVGAALVCALVGRRLGIVSSASR